MIEKVQYVVLFPESQPLPEEAVARFREAEKFPVLWTRKNRSLDLKEVVDFLAREEGNRIRLVLRAHREGVMRPEEVLNFIFGRAGDPKLRSFPEIQKLEICFKESVPCPVKS